MTLASVSVVQDARRGLLASITPAAGQECAGLAGTLGRYTFAHAILTEPLA